MKHLYDCIVVGGGPAGLSAAIYLARFNRSVLVVDRKEGRSTYPQINENYLGFPNGIAARELRNLGKKQAENFGADFIEDEVVEAKGKWGAFELHGEYGTYKAKTVILATGAIDKFPVFENYTDYIGKSMFWCIICDGHKTIGKQVVIAGNDDEAAITCMQFLNFTKKLTMITNDDVGATNISKKVQNNLKKNNIPLIEEKLVAVEGMDGMIESLHLSNGKSIKADMLFSHQGCNPNCLLATQLNVRLNTDGFLEVDNDQRSSVKGVYAAGDVSRPHSHQIVAAAHEGSMAAQAVNYDLYESYQKED